MAERVYTVVQKAADRYAVNWTEGERTGVVSGWYPTEAAALEAVAAVQNDPPVNDGSGT